MSLSNLLMIELHNPEVDLSWCSYQASQWYICVTEAFANTIKCLTMKILLIVDNYIPIKAILDSFAEIVKSIPRISASSLGEFFLDRNYGRNLIATLVVNAAKKYGRCEILWEICYYLLSKTNEDWILPKMTWQFLKPSLFIYCTAMFTLVDRELCANMFNVPLFLSLIVSFTTMLSSIMNIWNFQM